MCCHVKCIQKYKPLYFFPSLCGAVAASKTLILFFKKKAFVPTMVFRQVLRLTRHLAPRAGPLDNNLTIIAQRFHIIPSKTLSNSLFISSVSHPTTSSLSTRFCETNTTLVSGTTRSYQSVATQPKQSVYDFTVKDAKGQEVDLSKYRGKVLLIVNVASKCGFANSNYPELTTLYQKYKDQGLEILAFPSNQFRLEPGTNDEIQETVCTRFKAEYPVFAKVDVNGKNAEPLFDFLRSSKGGLLGDSIKWNFTKFLVDKEGKVVDRYAPITSPLRIEKDIKKLLGKRIKQPFTCITLLSGTRRLFQSMATQSKQSVYDFTVKDAKGQEVDLSKYRGKVFGFTNSNYPELTTLYQKYKDQGLEILAFPSNQFNGQEPGTNDEIQEFVCTRFKAEYPVFAKVDVNGKNAEPLYDFLRSSKGGLLGDSIKWNFTKFLVDREGKVVDRYAPTTTPLSIEKDIKKLLGDAKGYDVDLSIYKGKVVLVVNVASNGLTNNNYDELNQIYLKYKEKAQEPGTNEEIVDFVCTKFKSEFPIFNKIDVNGQNAAPVYEFLKTGFYGILGGDIQWNFSKFLVDKNGQPIDRYYPTTSPLTIERDIQKLLGLL
ncbi:hypothetical protein M8C21_013600 [Ambrosia artemisiifolia]|uniref:Glutathione peroxidase n=1 Tax=Ambrosia artemisiifolia TaxID=4212 RepID=A0AAD5CM86_AMBAR|nr:hypothetical protein M8C21_013600 [Ambrosia artemisiifolia]